MTRKISRAIWFAAGIAAGSAVGWIAGPKRTGRLVEQPRQPATDWGGDGQPSEQIVFADSAAVPILTLTSVPPAREAIAQTTPIGAHPAAGGAAAAIPSSPRWSSPTRYILGVGLFFAMLGVLYIGRSAIPMVLTAGLLAVFIQPVIAFMIQRFHMSEGKAVGVTYVGVALILIAIPLLAIPPLIDAVNFILKIDPQEVAGQLSQAVQKVEDSLPEIAGVTPAMRSALNSLQAVIENFAAATQPKTPVVEVTIADVSSRLGQALGALSRVLGPTVSALASALFTFLMSLQMALISGSGASWFAELVPPGHGPELSRLFHKIQRTWTGFLRGQMSLMLAVGLVTWLGGLFIGLPQALLLGVIAGLMELIPSVGPILAAAPAVIMALLFGSTYMEIGNSAFALVVIVFYVVVQLVENQLLVPYIMGEAVDMPPLVVLIGTVAGAGAFGIMGALLATPVIATGNLVFRYIYRKVLEQPPAPEPPEEGPSILERMKNLAIRFRRAPAPPAAALQAAGRQAPISMEDSN